MSADTPISEGCPDCGAHGLCVCPGWVPVDNIAHADLKGLLAGVDLSLEIGTA